MIANYKQNALKDILKSNEAILGEEYYQGSKSRMLNSTILNKLKEKNYKRVLQSNQSDSETQAMYFKYKEIEDSGMLREWINQVSLKSYYDVGPIS